MRRLLVGLCLCLALLTHLTAQVNSGETDSRAIFERLLSSSLTDGWMDQDEANNLREVYEVFLHRPLSVNTASLEDLKALPFLSEYKALCLIKYRTEHHGKISAISELKEIPEWDDDLCTLLYPLLSLSTPIEHKGRPLRTIFSEGKSRLSLLTAYSHNKEKTLRYLGSSDAVTLKYHYLTRRHLSLALAVQKDHYEPWTYEGNTLPDSYHGHVALRDLGHLRLLIMGQYRAFWGEGLMIGQGFSFYQTEDLASNRKSGISPLWGTSEQGYSQGLALDYGLTKHIGISLISSWRRIDGAVEAESLCVRGLTENGMHRDARSLWRKWQVPLNHYAGRLYIQYPRWSIALQGLYSDFGKMIIVHPPRSGNSPLLRDLNHSTLSSITGEYHNASHSLSISGELALTSQGGTAFISTSNFRIGQSDVRAELYTSSADYWSYFSKRSSYMHSLNDALSLFVATVIPLRRFKLRGDIEMFRHGLYPDSPQAYTSYALGASLSYALQKHWSIRIRLNYRGKAQRNSCRLKTDLSYKGKHLNLSWQLQSAYHSIIALPKVSLASGLTARYQLGKWYSFGSILLWNVPHWEERLYILTPKLNDEYLSALRYGQGLEVNLGAKLSLGNHFALGLRASHTFSSLTSQRTTYGAIQISYH